MVATSRCTRTASLRKLLAQQFQAAAQAVFGPLASDPQQAPAPRVDLVDQREVVVAAAPLNLVDADRFGTRQIPVHQAPGDGCRTESRTCSQVVWNTLATSFQESRRASQPETTGK